MGVSALDSHLGYALRMVSNAVSQGFARKLAGEGVTVAEWVMLRSLYDADAMAPSALAAQMGMTKGAITKLAERLVNKGLLARSGHADDRRRQSLALTGQGRAIVPALASLADHNDATFFSVLSEDQRRTLKALLARLVSQHALAAIPLS